MQPRQRKGPSRPRRLAGTHQARKLPSSKQSTTPHPLPSKVPETNGYAIPPPTSYPPASVTHMKTVKTSITPAIAKMPHRKRRPIPNPSPSPPQPSHSSLSTLRPRHPHPSPSSLSQIAKLSLDSPTLIPSSIQTWELPLTRTITPTSPLRTRHDQTSTIFSIEGPAQGTVTVDELIEAAGPLIDIETLQPGKAVRFEKGNEEEDSLVLNLRYSSDCCRMVSLRWL